MKFFAIPDPRRGAVSKEMLSELRQAGILPGNLGAFASEQHWIEATGVAAPSQGTAKYWRDNATIWQPWKEEFEYLVLARNADGSFARLDLVSKDAFGNVTGFSDPTFEHLSLAAANFYRQYAKHFPFIPKLTLRRMSSFDAGRLSFAPGVAEDYPLHIPSEMAIRFHPQTGQPEVFRWAEYAREHPMDWTPRQIHSGGRLSDGELVSAVSEVMASALSIAEKAEAIRQIAAR